MPLPTPDPRQPIHTRKITCQGFLRDDGLVDIEGHLQDTKPFDIPNKDRGGAIKAGEALHGLAIRITIDRDMTIRAVTATMDDTPYNFCKNITPVFDQLVGIQIAAGFRARLRAIMGGVKGCTHLTELMTPIATTAFQTVISIDYREQGHSNRKLQAKHSAQIVNTCHAHAVDSPVIHEHWPDYYRPSGDSDAD